MSRCARVSAVVVCVSVGAAAAVLGSSPPAARGDGDGGAGGAGAAPAADPPLKSPPKIGVGAEAPDFTLKDQDGKDVALSSFRGKKNVVVAFYPRAFTPGCTREMKCFSSEWRRVDDLGAQVLAVSGDPVAKLREFATAVGTRFPLLSDPEFVVAKTYGVFAPSADGGFASRSIFLVDREGKLAWIQKDYVAPKTLEGNELLVELEKIRPAVADPVAALATLASPERDVRTTLARYVQALLAEDARAVDRLLHRDYAATPGATAAMVKVRRDAELERLRKLFEAHDLKAVQFADVLDLRDGKILVKGDHEKPGILAGYTEEAKKTAADVAAGDMLLVTRTKALKLGDAPLLPRELVVTFRKDGDAWKVLTLGGR